MKIIRSGGTRLVILTKKYAIKLPRANTWKNFVQGMLSNITEGQWKGYDNKFLCPIKYSNKFGLVVVMTRARPVNHKGLFWIELERLYTYASNEPQKLDKDFFEYDALPKNFGYYNGHLVKIDYGV